jgi:hypothetical protein
MTSPWAAPTGAMPTAPASSPPHSAGPMLGGPPPPPRRRGRWWLVVGMSAVVLAAMAGTAAVTYVVAHNTSTPAPATPASPPTPTAIKSTSSRARPCPPQWRVPRLHWFGVAGFGGLNAATDGWKSEMRSPAHWQFGQPTEQHVSSQCQLLYAHSDPHCREPRS